MKWMIASDIHGSAYYCRELLAAFEREGAQKLLLLGDVLYHGPRNDLPRDYAPKRVIELLDTMPELAPKEIDACCVLTFNALDNGNIESFRPDLKLFARCRTECVCRRKKDCLSLFFIH